MHVFITGTILITTLIAYLANATPTTTTVTFYAPSFVPTQTVSPGTTPPFPFPPMNSLHDEPSISFSPINPTPGSDVTTYAVQVIRSLAWIYNPVKSQTYTVLSTPTTVDYTLIEGASTLLATISVPFSTPTQLPDGSFFSFDSSVQNCTFDQQTEHGVCQAVNIVPVQSQGTSTISGAAVLVTNWATQTLTGKMSGTLVPVGTVMATLGSGAIGMKQSVGGIWVVAWVGTVLCVMLGRLML